MSEEPWHARRNAMKLLIIEDSSRLQQALMDGLQKAGYEVNATSDGTEGLWLAQSNDYDVIILDLMLPSLDGMSILRSLRKEGKEAPVLILTAKDSIEDRVNGLQVGADDYLIKPFAFDELLARVQVLCRRRYGRRTSQIVIGDLCIDVASRKVILAGNTLDLTPREFKLLEYLVLRQDNVVSRSDIEAHVYKDSTDLMSNAVDSAICSLRRKLSGSILAPRISTRRGFGYVLEDKTK